MPRQAEIRSQGRVFDQVADAYDSHRPAYPDPLVDRACETAGLTPGAAVLEIGCGTGQLTSSLLARDLRVTAVEPGERLIALARERLGAGGDLQLHNERFEDARLPQAQYEAVFSASALHWIDPDVSWQKAADALADGGTLALISYFGLDDPFSARDQEALRTALATVAPDRAVEWPAYRSLGDILSGVEHRSANVSEVWSWLGDYDLARTHAADLFGRAEIAVVQAQLEHSAEEVNALLGTMSFWARLSPAQGDALAAENVALHQRLGRPIRSSTVACLVTARRKPRSDPHSRGSRGIEAGS